jgi:thiamine pyrophosphokinase
MADPTHALIVADGDVDAAWIGSLADPAARGPRPLLIAADGGAAKAMAAGYQPDVVVGDLDSLEADAQVRLRELGVDFQVAATDKDESDMELCLFTALDAGVTRISILGALGVVRPEHTIANLLLLAHPRLDGIDVEMLGHGSRISRIGSADGPGDGWIDGDSGDFVSLFPLGGAVEGVSTEGLRFPLHDERLPVGPSRGLSNELLGDRARVTSGRGRLLVVHTARTQDR